MSDDSAAGSFRLLARKLGQAPQNREHKTPVGGGRIRPRVAQRFEPGAGAIDLGQRVEEVSRRSRETIESRDDQHIGFTEGLYRSRQLSALGNRPTDFFLKHLGRARGRQFRDLSIHGLTVGRDPRVSKNRHRITLDFAPEFRTEETRDFLHLAKPCGIHEFRTNDDASSPEVRQLKNGHWIKALH